MPELTRQSGSDALKCSRDPRLGIIAVQLKCYAADLATALFAKPLDIGIPIPEWNPRQITSRPAGDTEGFDVTVSYEGHEDPDNADGESWELEGATKDDLIESHWNYEALLNPKKYGGKEDRSGHAKWPRTLPAGSGAPPGSRNPMHGVESWPEPGIIWNHNFCSPTLPASLLHELGTITKTLPPPAPPLNGNRDWLCIRLRARQRGNIWQIQTSHEASSRFGSVPEMYARS